MHAQKPNKLVKIKLQICLGKHRTFIMLSRKTRHKTWFTLKIYQSGQIFQMVAKKAKYLRAYRYIKKFSLVKVITLYKSLQINKNKDKFEKCLCFVETHWMGQK